MAKGENPSFVLQEPKSVSFEERPVPELKNPNDVLIRVNVTGICGSDIHYWQNGRIGDFILEKPMVLGHESSGTVHSVGSAVSHLKSGDRVALEPGIPCRYCDFCKAGSYNHCVEMKFAATPPYDGTLARYYILPGDFCVKLPENVSLEEGAMVEPLSVGVHVVKQADVRPGDKVVVFGAGPIGLLSCAVAKAYGASTVVCVDIVDSRLEFAKSYAATGIFNGKHSRDPAENAEKMKADFALGSGADKAIDATGAAPCILAGLYVLRRGGTFVQAGNGSPTISDFPILMVGSKELNVKGSFRYAYKDYETAVMLLSTGRLSVKELVTGRYAFTDAEKAFEAVRDGKGIKMLIMGPED